MRRRAAFLLGREIPGTAHTAKASHRRPREFRQASTRRRSTRATPPSSRSAELETRPSIISGQPLTDLRARLTRIVPDMPVSSLPPDQSALAQARYLVMKFDPTNAALSVFGDVSYSEPNLGDALRDAQEAAEAADARDEDRQYVVVSLTVMGSYAAVR